MRTIIKITKQEAIDAWKAFNNYHKDSDIIVEIEEETMPKYHVGSQYLSGIQQTQCSTCGEFIGNGIHNCRGYKVTC